LAIGYAADRVSCRLTTTNEAEEYMNVEALIVSKDRVARHGEVYTAPREVNAMLDLVSHETRRIESRFLEPACGHGNFLEEILRRKLAVVEERYGSSRTDFERYGVLAASSLYGIDIIEDNVVTCRNRVVAVFSESYERLFGQAADPECVAAVRYILSQNIVWGDALTLERGGEPGKPIVLPEWSPVNGYMLKRRDFTFRGLMAPQQVDDLPMFSDLGAEVLIPTPVRDYPVVHFLKVRDAHA
jgi:hypothetical protein